MRVLYRLLYSVSKQGAFDYLYEFCKYLKAYRALEALTGFFLPRALIFAMGSLECNIACLCMDCALWLYKRTYQTLLCIDVSILQNSGGCGRPKP